MADTDCPALRTDTNRKIQIVEGAGQIILLPQNQTEKQGSGTENNQASGIEQQYP
jgi:hypothetical protein